MIGLSIMGTNPIGSRLVARINKAYRMRSFTVILEHCPDTNLHVGHVPGFPGAHSPGETLDELRPNMQEVITMLVEDGEPALKSEFVGTQTIQVG